MVARSQRDRMIIWSLIFLFIVFILITSPIWRLCLPGPDVTKVLFQDIYYVRVPNGETEAEVFHRYMAKQGWLFVDQRGSLYRYAKEQDILEIRSTQIPTRALSQR